jgi:hypothetical protein
MSLSSMLGMVSSHCRQDERGERWGEEASRQPAASHRWQLANSSRTGRTLYGKQGK